MGIIPVKEIQYGAYVLTCAMDADQNLFMTQRTLEKLLGWRANQSREKLESKSLKAALPEGSNVGKISITVEGIKAKQSAIPIELALAVICWEAMENGNPIAKALVMSGFTADIKATILRAFGHEVNIDAMRLQEQFRWLRVFQFRQWTDIIRDRHLQLFGEKPSNEYYRDLIEMVNLALFDTKHFKCDRDTMGEEQQELIKDFEKMLVRQAKKYPDLNPKELVVQTLPMF